MPLDFEIAHDPFGIDRSVVERQKKLGRVVALQHIEDFVERIGSVFTGPVKLVENRLARTDVDSAVSARIDAVVNVDDERDEIVLGRFDEIVEIGSGREDVADIPFYVGRYPLLPNQYDRIFFALNQTGEVAIERNGGPARHQRIRHTVFEDVFVLPCQLDIEQFGDLFGFADLERIVVHLIDLEEGPHLHDNHGFRTVLLFENLLKLEIDIGQKPFLVV